MQVVIVTTHHDHLFSARLIIGRSPHDLVLTGIGPPMFPLSGSMAKRVPSRFPTKTIPLQKGQVPQCCSRDNLPFKCTIGIDPKDLAATVPTTMTPLQTTGAALIPSACVEVPKQIRLIGQLGPAHTGQHRITP